MTFQGLSEGNPYNFSMPSKAWCLDCTVF